MTFHLYTSCTDVTRYHCYIAETSIAAEAALQKKVAQNLENVKNGCKLTCTWYCISMLYNYDTEMKQAPLT